MVRGLGICKALRHCLFASSDVHLKISPGNSVCDARSVCSLLCKFKNSRVSLWGLREHEFDDRDDFRDPSQDEVIKGINKAFRNGWRGLMQIALRVTVIETAESPGQDDTDNRKHVNEFLSSLASFPYLTWFELSNPADGNPFLPLDSVKALAESLGQCRCLESFRISEYRFDPGHFVMLSDSIVKCNNLLELHLVGCRIPAAEVLHLAKALKDTTIPSQLTTLLLCDNGMDGHAISGWADVISDCTQLRRLEFTCNTISSVSASTRLVRSLRSCTRLYELRLESLGLEAVHVDGLSQACSVMSRLICLDIGSYHRPKYDIDAHVQALRFHNKLGAGVVDCLQLMQLNLLGSLYLSSVGLEAAGAKRLAELMERLPKLEALDLSSNLLGDEGLRAIIPEIHHCTNMTELFLAWNQFSGRGMASLGEQLQKCKLLETVDIAGNEVGIYSTRLVKKLIPLVERSLRVISLTHTGLHPQAEELLMMMTDDRIDFQFTTVRNPILDSDEDTASEAGSVPVLD